MCRFLPFLLVEEMVNGSLMKMQATLFQKVRFVRYSICNCTFFFLNFGITTRDIQFVNVLALNTSKGIDTILSISFKHKLLWCSSVVSYLLLVKLI